MPLAPWEPAERLRLALESLYQQTWQAQRLVISVDGQLSDQHAEVLRNALPGACARIPTLERYWPDARCWSVCLSVRMGLQLMQMIYRLHAELKDNCAICLSLLTLLCCAQLSEAPTRNATQLFGVFHSDRAHQAYVDLWNQSITQQWL